VLGLIWVTAAIAVAQEAAAGQILKGSRVVIAPMGGFETYFAAAVREKKVPITLTLDKSSAQYFVVSTESEWQGFVYGSAAGANWSRGGGGAWSGSSGSSTRGLETSIMLIDARTKDIVWAYEVHKSSHGALLLGTLAARGKQSVAEACAKHLKEFIERAARDGGNGGLDRTQGTAGHASNSSLVSSPETAALRPSASQQTASPSSVSVSSTPVGAEIYLDQDFVGNTPSTIHVQLGRHSVAVKKAGFFDWVREMTFSGGNITLSAQLLPDPASASVQTAKKQFSDPGDTSAAETPGSGPSDAIGWVGISTSTALGVGVHVVSVWPDGPAAKGGLRPGDIITQLNGVNVNRDDFETRIVRYRPGSTIRIGYMRNAWAFETKLTVSRLPM